MLQKLADEMDAAGFALLRSDLSAISDELAAIDAELTEPAPGVH